MFHLINILQTNNRSELDFSDPYDILVLINSQNDASFQLCFLIMLQILFS